MNALRLKVTYSPAHYVRGGLRPAIVLSRKPDPDCPDCCGDGVIAYDIDCINTDPRHCAPENPLLSLPLPRKVNPNYRNYRRRQRLATTSRGLGKTTNND
ncbi:hypothetical protein ABZ135_01320 [Streptomyces sp. NPDC006339]|uniref:hypothetical protein n=1 Tax=Streptomyces sp. NPDC006339 TaxID=3156755 RepID=UPI0033BE11CA